MIIDTLENASQYFLLNPLFEKAFAYLKNKNLDSLEVGVTEIEEGLRMIVFDEMSKTKEESFAKFECHNQNIDIQICLKGIKILVGNQGKNAQTQSENTMQKKMFFFTMIVRICFSN